MIMKHIFRILLASAVTLIAIPAIANEHKPLQGKRVAILIGEGFHSGETVEPHKYLSQLGAEVVIISNATGTLTAYNDGTRITVKAAIADVAADSFDALVLPGGRGPAAIRDDHNIRRFVREFFALDRPVAAICHGPLVLVSAGVLEGRTISGVRGIRDEVEAAGARYQNQRVLIDGPFITSRNPGDIPAFNEAIASALQR